MKYFQEFPTITYQGVACRDLTRRVAIVQPVLNNPFVFLPYTVEDGDKPEDVAYHYYGSVDYVWLVLLANNMVDPYHDWVLSTENFEQYMITKYAGLSGRKGYDVLTWAQNRQGLANIVNYYKLDEFGDKIFIHPNSFETIWLTTEDGQYLLTEAGERLVSHREGTDGWTPYRIYDYEWDLNEAKRSIRLVDRKWLPDVEREFAQKISSRTATRA